MRRLGGILIGIVIGGTLLGGISARPAVADHDCASPSGSNAPCPAAATGTPRDGTNGWHEEMPDRAEAADEHECSVWAEGWGLDEPGHSHFSILDIVVTCGESLLTVTVDGGNDGHPGLGDRLTVPPDLPEQDGFGPNCAFEHPPDTSHGLDDSVAWSHSSDYSGGSDTCPTVEDNDGCDTRSGTPTGLAGCAAPTTGPCGVAVGGQGDNNKADIVISSRAHGTAGMNPSWIKYTRLGSVMNVWGCSNFFSYDGARRFSGSLSISSNPRDPNQPACAPQPCSLALSGNLKRSAAWLRNDRP